MAMLGIVAGGRFTDADAAPFDDDENSSFDRRWNELVKVFGTDLVPRTVFTDAHKETLRFLARVFKKIAASAGASGNFSGDGTNGIGMRWTVVEDINTAVADVLWREAWSTGAAASRFSRNWFGATARDTVTFFAAASAITRDANNDFWSVVIMGVMETLNPAGLDGFFFALKERELAFDATRHNFLTPGSNSIMVFEDRVIFIDPATPFKGGVQVKEPGGADSITTETIPLAITFLTQRRALTQATITRPSAA